MKTLLLAYSDHGTGIRAIGGAAQTNLVDNRRAVYQPADGSDIRPGQCGVVEDVRVFHLPFVKPVKQFFARNSQRLGGTVKVHSMTTFVLYLGQ